MAPRDMALWPHGAHTGSSKVDLGSPSLTLLVLALAARAACSKCLCVDEEDDRLDAVPSAPKPAEPEVPPPDDVTPACRPSRSARGTITAMRSRLASRSARGDADDVIDTEASAPPPPSPQSSSSWLCPASRRR